MEACFTEHGELADLRLDGVEVLCDEVRPSMHLNICQGPDAESSRSSEPQELRAHIKEAGRYRQY